MGDVAKFPLRRSFAGHRNEHPLFSVDHANVVDDEFTVDGDGFASWSEPAPKPAPGTGQINALNESGQRQDMSIGK